MILSINYYNSTVDYFAFRVAYSLLNLFCYEVQTLWLPFYIEFSVCEFLGNVEQFLRMVVGSIFSILRL